MREAIKKTKLTKEDLEKIVKVQDITLKLSYELITLQQVLLRKKSYLVRILFRKIKRDLILDIMFYPLLIALGIMLGVIIA